MTRRTLITLFLAVVTFGGSALHASEAMKAIIDSYLEIQVQLAADKIDGVKSAASNIAAKAEAMGATGAPIVKAAKTMGDAADLQAAREALGALSDAVIAGAKADGHDLGEIKVAFCPMARKSWLQKGDKINNPYYGTMMASCGEIKK